MPKQYYRDCIRFHKNITQLSISAKDIPQQQQIKMAKKAPRKQLPPLKPTKAIKATKAVKAPKAAKSTKPSRKARSVSKSPSKSPSPSPARKASKVPAAKTKRIVKASKPAPKIRRSRSMEQTIREGEEYLNHRRSILASKEAEKTKAATKARKAAPVKSRSTGGRAPRVHIPFVAPVAPAVFVPPPVDTKRKTGTSKSKVSSSSKVNLKHDPTLPMAQFGVIDICFCIDATGSMSSYLVESKKTVIDIINKIETKVQTQGIQLRFAVVTYRDHPPQESTYVTKVQDFTDDRAIRNYIQKLDAFGGGDFAEAVHDGLLVAARDLTWRNYPMVPSLRYIFHVADAPPHGKQFDEGSKNGCTCGITTDAVTHAINHQQIHYRLIKIGSHPHLNKMEELFKKNIVDFESAEIKNASEMNIRVSDMIIREVMPL